MMGIRLKTQFLLLLFLIPTALCTEATITNATTIDVTTAEATTIKTTIVAPITVPTEIAESLSVESKHVEETKAMTPDPTITDVCGLSLIPSSEQNAIHGRCKCSNLNEDVDCGYLDASELPKSISFPKTVRNVNFQGNKIENIADDTFYNGRNVLELDLSHNHIDFVSTVAFKAFRSLKRLDLGHNKIWNVPSKSFQGLSELTFLDLSYNDISVLSSNLFATTPNLRELDLESNPLQELEPKQFEHLKNLEELSLESTLLQIIPDNLFAFTPNLKILDMSSNQLTEVPTDALKTLFHLKLLDLSGNPIKEIKQESFSGLRCLILLYLDRMPKLTRIEKYAFGDLKMLQELHCSYNFLLSEVNEYAFVRKIDNTKVSPSQVFFRQDSLSTLSKDFLDWNSNIELHIGDNPLSCDCHMQWMVNIKLKNDFQGHAKCASPSYLEDMTLSQLKDQELSCGLELSEIVMISCAVVVSLMLLALIFAFLMWRKNYTGFRRPYYKVSKKKYVDDIDYAGDDHI